MSWGADFNEFYNEKAAVYLAIFARYPRLGAIIRDSSVFRESEDIFYAIYHLYLADILTLDDDLFDPSIERKIIDFLMVMRAPEKTSGRRHFVNTIGIMRSFDCLNTETIETLHEMMLSETFIIFSIVLNELNTTKFFINRSAQEIIPILFKYSSHIISVMQSLSAAYGDCAFQHVPEYYLEVIFALCHRGENLIIRFENILGLLFKLHAATQLRVSIYFMATKGLLDAKQNDKAFLDYFLVEKIRIRQFSFLQISAAESRQLYHHANKIDLLCDAGLAVDDISEYLSRQTFFHRETTLLAVNKKNSMLLSFLMLLDLSQGVVLSSLLNNDSLDKLSAIYDSIMGYYFHDRDMIFSTLIKQLMDSAGDDPAVILSDFLKDLQTFGALPMSEEIRDLFVKNSDKVSLMTHMGFGINKLIQMSYFLPSILEAVTPDAVTMLNQMKPHLSTKYYYMVVVNAMPEIASIALKIKGYMDLDNRCEVLCMVIVSLLDSTSSSCQISSLKALFACDVSGILSADTDAGCDVYSSASFFSARSDVDSGDEQVAGYESLSLA